MREDDYTKPNGQRRDRWALNMRALWYQIFHIDGEENRLADLGTRWGNRFLSREAFKKGLRCGPRLVAKHMVGAQPHHDDCCVRKCALRLPPPKTVDDIVAPDRDANPDFVLPRVTDMVDKAFLAASQRAHIPKLQEKARTVGEPSW